jgi:hypothetical protein
MRLTFPRMLCLVLSSLRTDGRRGGSKQPAAAHMHAVYVRMCVRMYVRIRMFKDRVSDCKTRVRFDVHQPCPTLIIPGLIILANNMGKERSWLPNSAEVHREFKINILKFGRMAFAYRASSLCNKQAVASKLPPAQPRCSPAVVRASPLGCVLRSLVIWDEPICGVSVFVAGCAHFPSSSLPSPGPGAPSSSCHLQKGSEWQ